ncbi:hypothetical protein F2Q68_00022415 [Brassica cretica]|uniref:Uncharacterized protein n=1 Tax=Brassica cretica TaxID=69181 RepID=A0A8S9FVU2_BRACR|nr:hypothetical protein F2Q68_00022415 [Brassica cretica]
MKGVIMECPTPVLWDLLNLHDKASVLHNWILRMCNILNVLQVTFLCWIPMECNIIAEILQKVLGGITVSNWICCKQGHIMASKSHLTRSFSLKLICEGCWRDHLGYRIARKAHAQLNQPVNEVAAWYRAAVK